MFGSATPSLFGAAPPATPTPTPSLFGAPQPGAPPSGGLFGGGGSGASLFGVPAKPAAGTPFGGLGGTPAPSPFAAMPASTGMRGSTLAPATPGAPLARVKDGEYASVPLARYAR
jgi:hypothetical protein